MENAQLPDVTDQQVAENTCRMEYEDSLRNAYVATFYTPEMAFDFAAEYGLNPKKTTEVLVASRGNHAEISAFLAGASQRGAGKRALDLLLSISTKDLRDTPCEILEDHLYNTSMYADVQKVLCPRVNTELLTPYRAYLQNAVPESLADSICQDPALLVAWCNENLTLYNAISMRYIQISPRRVWETRIADKTSREIFFVAMCRSFGVPAWTDPVTGVLKYEKDGLVYDVDFEAVEQAVAPKGRLQLKYSEIPLLDDPKYEVHFTLSKYDGGTFRLMDYDSGTWSQLFKNPAQMDCGYYMLVSGSRMSGGNVFTDVEFDPHGSY